jgi:acetolactate synthase-1/2/3 large subunit
MIASLTGAGVDVCFMNPGTSEMHFVAALDAVPEMRGVLALFEGVATGAAAGYARIAGRPAAVLLHLGPGLANGLANLHNARRAGTPVLVIVGAHATGHVRYDAPLQSDIEALARTVSGWVHTSGTTRDVGRDAVRAVAAARRGQIATLVLPADVSWGDDATPARAIRPHWSTIVDDSQIVSVAGLLSARALLFLGGRALSERGLRAASRISAATGARLLAETFPARMERGAGLPAVDRLAYLAEQAEDQLAGTGHLILAGARSPVSFFAYPGRASDLVPAGCSVTVLADRDQDAEAALEELADLVAAGIDPLLAPASRPAVEPGPLTAISLANTIAASLPEGAIVSDEANTSGFALPKALTCAPRHSLLTLTGGSIGQGMPVATGAAIATPDRPVVSLEADGSALYTIQALWTQAREQLDVTTVLINNAAYAILRMELARTAAGQAGPRASRMLDLSGPTPDFTAISTGLGVPAVRVTTAEDLDQALRRAYAEAGPHLIEAMVPPVVPAPGTAWLWRPELCLAEQLAELVVEVHEAALLAGRNDPVGAAQEPVDRRGRRLELRMTEGGGHRDVQDRRPGSFAVGLPAGPRVGHGRVTRCR